MIINFIVQVILKSQFNNIVVIIYTLQFFMALKLIKFTQPVVVEMFFEHFTYMYEFKFLNLAGFITIFDKDFEFEKFVDQRK